MAQQPAYPGDILPQQLLSMVGVSKPITAKNKAGVEYTLNPWTHQWVKSSEWHAYMKALEEHPLRTSLKTVGGALEAYTGGVLEMSKEVAGSLHGAVGAATAAFTGKPPTEGFVHEKEVFDRAWQDVLGDVTKPQTKEGYAINRALGLIPEAIQKAGDVAYAATGSPAIGADTQALVTLLTLEADKATKAVKGAWDKIGPKGTKPVQETFGKMADENPEVAQALIDHLDDPKVKKELQARVDAVTLNKKQLDEIFKVPRKAKPQKPSVSGEVTPEDLGKMFDPNALQQKEKEAQIEQTLQQKAAQDAYTKALQEDLMWQQHEAAKQNLSQRLAATAIPSGVYTDLRTGMEVEPTDTQALRHAFEAALFGKSGMNAVLGPLTPDMLVKAKDWLGQGEDDSLGGMLRKAPYTLKTLSALPQDKLTFNKAEVRGKLGEVKARGPEQQVIDTVLNSVPGDRITAKDLVAGFRAITQTLELTPVEDPANRYAKIGIDRLGRLGQVRPSLTKYVMDTAIPHDNHMGNYPYLYGWTRHFDEDGVKHVVELQSDLPKHFSRVTVKGRGQRADQVDLYTKMLGVGKDAIPGLKNYHERLINETLHEEGKRGRSAVRFIAPESLAEAQNWPRSAGQAAQMGFTPQQYTDLLPRMEAVTRFYTDTVAPTLKKLGGKLVTDKYGHKWYEVPTPEADIIANMGPYMFAVLGPFHPEMVTKLKGALRKIPGYKSFEHGLVDGVTHLIETLSPESLGPEAKRAGAIIGEGMALRQRLDTLTKGAAEGNYQYFQAMPEDAQLNFIKGLERGQPFADPKLEALRQQYAKRNQAAYEFDQANGIIYDPRDNYLYHLWKDPEAAERFFFSHYGLKWGSPKFIKERGWELYEQGIKAGLEPLYTNPEEIMQAREFASNLAAVRVAMLRDLQQAGIAIEKVKGLRQPAGTVAVKSPNGTSYFVHQDAARILHNAFDTPSLWQAPGFIGQAFRGWMEAKNRIVPLQLSLSAFHPLHLALGMDMAADMTRNTKELLAGAQTPMEFLGRQAKAAAIVPGLVERSKSGFRLVDVWKGAVPESEMTQFDHAAVEAMVEGGFVPLTNHHFTETARANFKTAVRRVSAKAVWYAPWAALETLQAPIFEKWIPALKAANYLQDVTTAMRADPSLLTDRARRQQAFRKIAKSVDNRFGEMNYDQLFWHRWARDIGVASTLSMGWTLGFVREFGSAPIELAKLDKPLSEAVVKGELDKAMFVGYYMTGALALGGLITWAMTGQMPQEMKDYVYPKDGENGRMNTPFYTREFGGLYYHMRNEGIMSGLTQFAVNKAAPGFEMVGQFLTNLDYMNREISDPNAPFLVQTAQKLKYIMGDLDPLSMEAAKEAKSKKGIVSAFMGFPPAPHYVEETPIEGRIKKLAGYYNRHVIPYDKAKYSEDMVKLHKAAREGDTEAYQTALSNLQSKYNLSGHDLARIQKHARTDPLVSMFKSLSPSNQVALLKKMTPEEQSKYLRAASSEAKRRFLSEIEQ
jgi:hypothetical protein